MNPTELKISDLPPDKRQAISNFRDQLTTLLADVEARQRELDYLKAALADAESRSEQYKLKSATDEKTASKLSAAEVQLRQLPSKIQAAARSLGNHLRVIAAELVEVRKFLRNNFGSQLVAPLFTQLKTALTPFFPPGSLASWADSILPSTWPYRWVFGWANQDHSGVATLDDARSLIGSTVKELDAILAGETLLEVPPPHDLPEKPPPNPRPALNAAAVEMIQREAAELKRRDPALYR